MRLVGAKVPRVEDRRILTGRGRYVDDLQLPHMLHAAFLRSPFAHARITGLDVTEARQAPGVVAVYTGEDMKAMTKSDQAVSSPMGTRPGVLPPGHRQGALRRRPGRHGGRRDPLPGRGRLRADRGRLRPAAARVDLRGGPRPGQSAALRATSTATSSSPAAQHFGDVDAAFAEADRVVERRAGQHRIANVPMETRGLVADYDPASGELTYHAATQCPQGLRHPAGHTLGHPLERLRVLTGDVGGAFGLKGNVYPRGLLSCVATKLLGRPVKWIEDRNEHLLASGHAREENDRRPGGREGRRRRPRPQGRADHGPGRLPGVPFRRASLFPARHHAPAARALPGQGLHLRRQGGRHQQVHLRRLPRSWEMETWVRERLLDIVAHELGLDPAEVRRRNMLDGEPTTIG